ncbi:MAG: flagellar motor protein MotB [Aeromonas sp.]
MSDNNIIIVKRGGRKSGGAAGGAWKVAFADFTLAMMAFFMVMWLQAVTSKEELQQVSSRLRDYSILEGGENPFDLSNSPFPVDLEGKRTVIEEPELKEVVEKSNANEQKEDMQDVLTGEGESQFDKLLIGTVEGEVDKKKLAHMIEALAKQMKASDNVTLQIAPQGVRILIRDSEEREMYTRGSARMTPFFRQLLMALAPVFKKIDNRVMISGHTDSLPFAGSHYSNWELSSDRAMMARRVLLMGGMPGERIGQVVAMGDTQLDDPSEPTGSRNRRIELMVLTAEADEQLSQLFSSEVERAVKEAREAIKRDRLQAAAQAGRTARALAVPSTPVVAEPSAAASGQSQNAGQNQSSFIRQAPVSTTVSDIRVNEPFVEVPAASVGSAQGALPPVTAPAAAPLPSSPAR